MVRRQAKAAPPRPAKPPPSRTTSSVLPDFLELQSDTIPQGIGLHALLLPLKQQLVDTADRLQALV
ncbi:DUF1484 family protein [Cupriavidus necator]|uniref:DUF1484 family protein n=1 Tax=Cupriavidus necator TaxID=106590 RepID=UPI0030F3D7AB